MRMKVDALTLTVLGKFVASGSVEPLELTKEQESIITGAEEAKRNFVVSENMWKLRKSKKITQKDFAKKIGVSQPFCSYFEKRNKIIPIVLYPHIAKALGVTVEQLLKEE